jgi:hypothetical protein
MFEDLARALGIDAVREPDEFTQSFLMTVDGRTFEVRHEYRASRHRGGSEGYRGPTGHLLITSTPLSGERWEMHQVDIVPGGAPSLFGDAPHKTGDEAFDRRFLVRQDGIPVRDTWLDQATRAAFGSFFDTPGATGPAWVQEQRLQHFIRAPWKGIDGPVLRALLQKQAALADALERTARRRDGAF